MAKFLDKKEQVFDIKLTSYGHHLLSTGRFKPAYYGFFDDNILYDSEYAGFTEQQNETHERIKQNTQYIESLILFEDINKNVTFNRGGPIVEDEFEYLSPFTTLPRQDFYNLSALIGDAKIDGNSNTAPAWKVVTLQGDISSSSQREEATRSEVPQINIEMVFKKRVVSYEYIDDGETIERLEFKSGRFADDNVVFLSLNSLLLYLEEVNTEILNENFEVEVYDTTNTKFERKFFKNKNKQIVDGYMISETPTVVFEEDVEDKTAVEYYFDFLTDSQIEQELACKRASIYNKSSYYVSMDFECEESTNEQITYDIYGKVTESEICPE